jgi:uncharacterized protein
VKDALERGLAAYAAGDFFAAHEHFEALWLEASHPGLRLGRQGLVLVAVAMHKLFAQHNPAVAARLLHRAIDRLERGEAIVDGIESLELSASLRAAAEALERGETIRAPPLAREGSR